MVSYSRNMRTDTSTMSTFQQDKLTGLQAEMTVASYFLTKDYEVFFPAKTDSSYNYDLEARKDGKKIKLEVKKDLSAKRTGNIVLELAVKEGIDNIEPELTGFQRSELNPVIYTWVWETELWFVHSSLLHELDFSKYAKRTKKQPSLRYKGDYSVLLALIPIEDIFEIAKRVFL